MKSLASPWFTVLYASLFGVILVLAYTGHLPPYLTRIPYYDKVGHVVLYAVAAYLGHRLLAGYRLRWAMVSLPLWPTLFGFLTILEEWLQQFSPNRTFSGIDLLASLSGLLLGYWLAEHPIRPSHR